jgi:LysM repeat protein
LRYLIILLLLICLLPVVPVEAQSNSAYQLIDAVNRFRADHGLPAFQVNGLLMQAATGHANWMDATGNFGHTGEGGSSIRQRAEAVGFRGYIYETISGGSSEFVDVNWAVHWWSNSTVHRNIMLSNNTQVGAGVAGGNGSRVVFVMMVGTPYRNSSGGAPTTSTNNEALEEGPEPIEMVPITLAEPNEDGAIIHHVQLGQTAWAIAVNYGVELDEILTLNHITRNTLLQIGDELIIKLGPNQQPPPEPTVPVEYLVQDGQTLWEIAVTNDLELDDLLAMNGLVRGDIIQPGDTLLLRVTDTPEPSPTSPPPTITPTTQPPSPTATSTPPPSPTKVKTAVPLPSPTQTLAPTVVAVVPTSPPAAPVEQQTSIVEDDDSNDIDDVLIVALLIAAMGVGFVVAGALILFKRD